MKTSTATPITATSRNPRSEFVLAQPGARFIVDEGLLGGALALSHVAFDTTAQRDAAAEAMRHAEMWTSLVLYRDTQGPAIQAMRNPGIGPIRRYCSVQ